MVASGGTLGGNGIISGAVTRKLRRLNRARQSTGHADDQQQSDTGRRQHDTGSSRALTADQHAGQDYWQHPDRGRHAGREQHRCGRVHRRRQFQIVQRRDLCRFVQRRHPAAIDGKSGLEHQRARKFRLAICRRRDAVFHHRLPDRGCKSHDQRIRRRLQWVLFYCGLGQSCASPMDAHCHEPIRLRRRFFSHHHQRH